MNNDIFQGKWKQVQGNVKQFFGKLTDDDMKVAEGGNEKMVGVLQERYGYSKEQAQTEWDKFMHEYGNDAHDAKETFEAAATQVKTASKN